MDQFSTCIPDVVLLSGDLPAPAKIVYATFLQQAKSTQGRCSLSVTQLAALTHFSKETVVKSIHLLTQAGLVIPVGKSQYEVRDSSAEAWVTLLDQVILRLAGVRFYGEQLMRELLSLMVSSDRFIDGARPEWLVNPLTGERMEYDRLYLDGVAFEFNGPQHYGATTKYPSTDEARKRRGRDLIKRGLSAENGVTLVTVHREDLSIKGMLAKIGNLLPIRPGVFENPVGKYLEQECQAYRHSKKERDIREFEARQQREWEEDAEYKDKLRQKEIEKGQEAGGQAK